MPDRTDIEAAMKAGLKLRDLVFVLLGILIGVAMSQREMIDRLDRERMATRMREVRGDRLKTPPRIIDERVGEAITESAAELHSSSH